MIRKILKWAGIGFLIYFAVSVVIITHAISESTKCKGNQHTSNKIEYLTFSRSQYPHIVGHIERSWKRGVKKTMRINREGADKRRDKLLNSADGLKKWPRRHNEDRDESPAAALRDTVKADVEYVDDHENQSAGSHLRYEMAPWCDGTRVRYRFITFSFSRARGTA